MKIEGQLAVLLLEDSEKDIELVYQKLADDFDCTVLMDCASAQERFLELIHNNSYDIILADYTLPGYTTLAALQQVQSVCPQVPFIVVSGTIGEDTAVEMLKQGAADYVLKDRLGRLAFAISRAMEAAQYKKEKQLQAEHLKVVNQSLKQAQQIAHIGSFEWDIINEEFFLSDETCRIFGFKPVTSKIEMYKGMSYTFMSESDKSRVSDAMDRALNGPEPLDVEYWADMPDGKRKYIHTQANVQRDDEGFPVKMLGTHHDITERKLAEEGALRHAAFENTVLCLAQNFINIPLERLDYSINNAMQMMAEYYEADRATVYRYDWELRQAVRIHKWVENPQHYTDDQWNITSFKDIDLLIECHKNGQIFRTPTKIITDSGYTKTAEMADAQAVISVPILREGLAIGAFTLSSPKLIPVWADLDLSIIKVFCEMLAAVLQRIDREKALQEANESNRRILDSTVDAIAMIKKDGTLFNVNEAFAKRYSTTVEAEIGKNYKDLLPKELYGDLFDQRKKIFDRVFETGEPEIFEDFRDGRCYRNRYFPVIKDGLVSLVTVFSTDITDSKKAEAEAIKNAALKTLVNYLPVAVGITDVKGQIIEVNNATLQMWGGKAPLSKDISEFAEYKAWFPDTGLPLKPEDWPIARLIATGEDITGQVLDIERFDGKHGRIINSVTSLKDDEENLLNVISIAVDITDLTQLQEELQKQETHLKIVNQSLKEAQQLAHIGSFEWDIVRDEVFWSDEACRIFGFEPDQDKIKLFSGISYTYMSESDRRMVTAAMEKAMIETAPLEVEYWINLPDGKKKYLHVHTKFQRDAEGRAILMSGTYHDITERKQAEQKLIEAKEELAKRATDNYLMLNNSIGQGFFVIDVLFDENDKAYDMYYVEANKATVDILGFDFTGKRLREIDPNYEEYWYDIFGKVAKTGESERLERYSKPDDKWFNFYAFKIEGGEGRRIGNIFFDITERKRAEEALRESKDNAMVLVEELKILKDDLTAEVEALNKLYLISTQYIRQEQMQHIYNEILDAAIAITHAGKGNMQIMEENEDYLTIVAHQGFNKPFLQHFEKVSSDHAACGWTLKYKKRAIVEDIEKSPIFIGTPDLQVLLNEGVHAVQSTPMLSRSGKCIGVLSTHYITEHKFTDREMQMLDLLACQAADVVERNRTERALQQTKEQALDLVEELKKADQNKNEFLSVLSHELRNPLATIVAGLSLMEITEDKQKVGKAKEIMSRQIDQLCHLVDDLLNLTRITMNKVELKKEKIELNKIALSAAEDYRKLFENKGVELATETNMRSIYLDADPVRLTQIIGNLLHNALKFTPAGGQAQLTTHEEKNEAVIRVQDNGIGIKPEFLPEIFESFKQVDVSLDRRNSGLGLGLSIVKGIAELHGGSVNADSEGLGKGSIFTILLPITLND